MWKERTLESESWKKKGRRIVYSLSLYNKGTIFMTLNVMFCLLTISWKIKVRCCPSVHELWWLPSCFNLRTFWLDISRPIHCNISGDWVAHTSDMTLSLLLYFFYLGHSDLLWIRGKVNFSIIITKWLYLCTYFIYMHMACTIEAVHWDFALNILATTLTHNWRSHVHI